MRQNRGIFAADAAAGAGEQFTINRKSCAGQGAGKEAQPMEVSGEAADLVMKEGGLISEEAI